MHSPSYIDRNPVSSVAWLRCADGDLAADLDHAEFGERLPALQTKPGHSYADPSLYFYSVRHVPAVADYLQAWESIKAAHRPPRLDAAHPRRQLATARHRFGYLSVMPDRARGLRTLMDYYFHKLMAFADFKSLERQAKRHKVNRERAEAERARRLVTIPERDRMVGVRRYG